MVEIDINKTELVWPGKYNEDGSHNEIPKLNLPFQVIETINESRATREANKGGKQSFLFDVYEGEEGDTFEDGWTNKLIWGDNLLVMNSLLEKFAGKVDLIYIDPPFATGADFSFTTQIGDTNEEIFKEQSMIEEKAYRDTWGNGIESYLNMLLSRLFYFRALLSEKGSIYVHCDWRMNSFIRLLLDETFGSNNFRGHIIWRSMTPSGFKGKTSLGKSHDDILYYSKNEENFIYNPQKIPYDEKYLKERFNKKDKNGRLFKDEKIGTATSQETIERLKSEDRIYITSTGTLRIKHFKDEADGYFMDDLWMDIFHENSQSENRTGYDTQKPEALLERIIKASSNPGDLVADFFCGSGTTLASAEKLGRRWIGCDIGRYAIHISRKRMLSIEGCRPFEILNLGRYERQYWQGVTFNRTKNLSEQSLYEYLAFILKLYGAQPVPGLTHIHGKKGRALVHIGAVDAPVTIDEINAAITECVSIKQPELHILGWDWEMGLYDLMVVEAKKQGIKLVLLQIPREVMEEQAVERGDIRFFELAFLEINVKYPKKSTASITLKDFVIPNTELIPDEIRSKIKKWSDYIDYWAVDWNYQNDTFLQSWVTYRTRKDRTLLLTSDPHTYKNPGTYRILVKVVDIFGNDTSQAFEVKVA